MESMRFEAQGVELILGGPISVGEIRRRCLHFLRDYMREQCRLLSYFVRVLERRVDFIGQIRNRRPSDKAGLQQQKNQNRKAETQHSPNSLGLSYLEECHRCPASMGF